MQGSTTHKSLPMILRFTTLYTFPPLYTQKPAARRVFVFVGAFCMERLEWPPLPLWPYSAEKLFISSEYRSVCGRSGIPFSQEGSRPEAASAAPASCGSGGAAGSRQTLSVTFGATLFPLLALPFSPGRGKSVPKGSPWHSGKVVGSSAKCAVSPEALPLGELASPIGLD